MTLRSRNCENKNFVNAAALYEAKKLTRVNSMRTTSMKSTLLQNMQTRKAGVATVSIKAGYLAAVQSIKGL